MVLSRLKEAGLRLKREKYEFEVSEIEFLGFVISKEGIRPSETKFAAIQKYPEPKTKKELQQFLGLINFYAPFLKDKASVAEPLHRLIVVDAYSGWLEVQVVPSTSSESAIRVLRNLFATHSIPKLIASDNGTGFTSSDFQKFCRTNAISQTLIAPFHPSSNGRAEQTVRSAKTTLKKLFDESPSLNGDWHLALNRFLIQQHVTPHSSDGVSPAELLMGRKLRTVLDAIRPDRSTRPNIAPVPTVESQPVRNFDDGTLVFARNFGQGPPWIPAVVNRRTGPVNYEVRSGDNLLHRHSNQIRSRSELSPDQSSEENISGQPAFASTPMPAAPIVPEVQTPPIEIRPTLPPRSRRDSYVSYPSW